jgi:hypothetical protein
MITPWASLERLVRTLLEAERAHAAAIDGRLADVAQRVAQQPTAKDLRELRQAVRALAPADDRQVLDELARMAASQRPMVVGPWTGELGFELLYWIPFVQWVRSQWDIAPARQLVVSRGGVAAWYAQSQTRYADVLSCLTPAEFRDAVTEAKRKQRRVTSLDERILERVLVQGGGADVECLHPRFMYRLFAPYWSDEAGFARIEQFSRYRRLDVPDGGLPGGLPAEYVAVRFYFSECFPDTPDNRAFVQSVVSTVAEQMPVVLLNPGFSVDEHEDWAPSVRHRIHDISGHVTPERNLAVQSAVISRARAFAGTYGGYSYLAPMYGVPAVAFYSRATFKRHHLYAAQRVLEQMKGGPLTVVDVTQASLLGATLASAVRAWDPVAGTSR